MTIVWEKNLKRLTNTSLKMTGFFCGSMNISIHVVQVKLSMAVYCVTFVKMNEHNPIFASVFLKVI